MELRDRVKRIYEQSFCVKPEESILIITDEPCRDVGELFASVADEVGYRAELKLIPTLTLDGAEPSDEIAQAMRDVDVAIAATSKSITHTNARIEATRTGTRVITMPGINLDMIENGAAGADYRKIEELTRALTGKLDRAKRAVIEKDGHRLTLNLDGRPGIPSPGVFCNPGDSGNFPSGEAFIAPLEHGADGSTVIDGSMVSVGLLDEPLVAYLEHGKLVRLEGKHAKQLDVLMATPENATIAELGIGTNDAARLTGLILEDEKIYGTVHIAFGTNTSFGGINKAELHFDGVICKPTLYLDDELVMDAGTLLIEA